MASSANTDNCEEDQTKMSQGDRNTSFELIKEKMKEKRRKKALNDSNTSWSRQHSKRKGANASFALKASLRSNNQSLAKALAVSKHDSQMAHQTILELQRDRQFLLQHANATRLSEKECVKRFGNIKQVLTKVTTSLLDAVTSLSQALDLCSSLPIQGSSMGITPRSSVTSDDDSFLIVQQNAEQGPSTNCRKTELWSSAIQDAASKLMQAASDTTATINQSEPAPEPDKSQPVTSRSKTVMWASQPNEGTKGQSEQTVGCQSSDKSIDFDDLNLEFPSLDEVDIPLRFIDESSDICSSRRRSGLLNPPLKNSRITTVLDPVASENSPAGDDGDHTCAQNHLVASPLIEQQSPNSSDIRAKSHKEKGPAVHADKRTAAVSRRATYNITPGRPEEPANRTFEVVDPEESPASSAWPEFGVSKKRYVFVHSPPGESSNYRTLDMELTAVTNDSMSASQDEANKSMANKSRFNHDDQIIRPWGNIQSEKPTMTKATKTQTKPPANATKSKLPKPEKESGKTGKELKEPGKTCLAKKSKDAIKKASKKSKKVILALESAKNDLGVFDLSAGESFSLPPPLMNQTMSKPANILTGLGKDSNHDQGDVGCFNNGNELDPNCQVGDEKEHRCSKIKRKSKKARSVVTPGINKTAATGREKKLVAITADCELESDDVLDGTYLGVVSQRPNQKQPTKARKMVDAEKIPPKTKIPQAASSETDQTTGIRKASSRPPASKEPPSENLDDITDDLCIKKNHVSSKASHPRGRPGQCKEPEKSSTLASTVSFDPGCGPSDPASDVNHGSPSLKNPCRDKGSSNQSKRGQKRMADALEEQEEEELAGAGVRRSRRGTAVCYKEPRLNQKMRNEDALKSKPKTKKKTSNKKVGQRKALGTVTNIV